MLSPEKIMQSLEFINISNDEFTIFEWKPPRSFKSFVLDLNILKKNRSSNIFFHVNRGNMKIAYIRMEDLIYSAGSDIEIQFQLLEALIEQIAHKFLERYDIESYLGYGKFSPKLFDDFKPIVENIIFNFKSLNLVKEIKVPCTICDKVLPLIIKKSFIEKADSYPVPIVYSHLGHSILCFIDRNYDVRGVELVNITG
ncbi:MAG: hypothetical protein ACFE8E_04690 [Candidatus Hodarchaeota archaeon]